MVAFFIGFMTDFQLAKRDYDYAKRLASEDPDFDTDLINKKQWLDMQEDLNEELVNTLVIFFLNVGNRTRIIERSQRQNLAS